MYHKILQGSITGYNMIGCHVALWLERGFGFQDVRRAPSWFGLVRITRVINKGKVRVFGTLLTMRLLPPDMMPW